MWAADPEYKHIVRNVPNGPAIHVLYKFKPNSPTNDAEWTKIADAAVQVLPFIEKSNILTNNFRLYKGVMVV
jgi:hypothetical protein